MMENLPLTGNIYSRWNFSRSSGDDIQMNYRWLRKRKRDSCEIELLVWHTKTKMATIIQQKQQQLTSTQEKRFPLVDILTSKPEDDEEKVRSSRRGLIDIDLLV